jgi:predicted nuclease of restriction endonuclease-like RecB superfamily
MLTAALRVYHWDRRTSSISSDRLDAEALPFLKRAITACRSRVGQRRGEVRNAARAALEGLRPDRIEPVVKLLDDVATYEWPQGARQAERRVAVFEAAARVHPLVDAREARQVLGTMFDPPPGTHDEAVARLYADYPEFHRLADFPRDYTAEALRADYGLAQAQALLFSATQVTVDARHDFKHVLRYARLARLLHRLQRSRTGYRFVFDGPNSVLRRTHAYGVEFARFLAALVRLRDWVLTAEITLRRGWRPLTFTLAAEEGLGGDRRTPVLFDSTLEEAFARRFGAERDGWQLSRESIVLETGGTLLVPDFVFRHADGTEVVLEIVGYWTPEYLEEKFRKLAGVGKINLIVAVPKRLALRAEELPAAVLPFAKRLLLRELMPRLDAFRPPSAGT